MLGAARAILENATRYRESVEGAARLSALEEKLGDMDTNHKGGSRW